MKNIILSAFGCFGDYIANSSELASRKLAGRVRHPLNIVPVVFECKIPDQNQDRGKLLLETALSLKASAIISLGMASDKLGFCVETRTTNAIDCPKYCPELCGQAIDPHISYGETLELDLAQWNIQSFRKRCELMGLLSTLSEDAGGFCCNHLIWQMRMLQLRSERYSKIPFVFLHIPCSPECVKDPEGFARSGKFAMKVTQVVSGIKILLDSAHFAPTS